MTDDQLSGDQLSGLFAEGTAPENDLAFVREVAAGIDRARLRLRLLALAPRVAGALIVAAAAFVAAGAVKPVLAQLVEGAPQFMGVPLPVVLAIVALGLAAHARRYLRSSNTGASPLELID